MATYLTAQEAAEKLGVSISTLYSYVSRGLVRSEAVDGNTRQRRYHAADIEALIAKREASRNPESVAENALNWGVPVLESALTLIVDHRVYYRGHNVMHLASQNRFEDVAALLWTGDAARAKTVFAAVRTISAHSYLQALPGLDSPYLTDLQRLQAVIPLIAADDVQAYDFQPQTVIRVGVRLLHLMALIMTRQPSSSQDSIAAILQSAWCPHDSACKHLLDAALILCADHELNASAFTARVVAAAESTPYAAVIAALSTFQGIRHGGHSARVGALLREIGEPHHTQAVIIERLRRGDAIPGFGHPLYPEGDPRGRKLIALVRQHQPDSLALQILDQITRLISDKHPNIDFALIVLTRSLGLPDDKAMLLFALGRTAGWIGHIMEQYADGQLIRPRAKYNGVLP